jgi:hypothetical protein
MSESVSRKEFQDFLEKAKGLDFESDHRYIKCPEMGKDARLKICAMTMKDSKAMTTFAKELDEDEVDYNSWMVVLMFSAKDENGEYLFAGRDGISLLQSMGIKWYHRYGITAMTLSGFMEEFRATKK